jgi:hypothetical protein
MKYIDTILNLALVSLLGSIIGLWIGHNIISKEDVPMFPDKYEVERAFHP